MESVKVGINEMWNYSKQKLTYGNEQKNDQRLKENHVVVMHVHGGGFVAMSSSSHQNYTRMWANSLGIPVFSVDYRLSPESKFPDAVNDIWQVYYWLLEEGEKHLGIRIDHVILAGDSAGGNLIAALTILCIKKGYKVPLALVMSYPAAYVGALKFAPSLLLSLDDMLLPSRFLKHAISAYKGDIDKYQPDISGEDIDLLSPMIASPEILSQFPQTLIQVC